LEKNEGALSLFLTDVYPPPFDGGSIRFLYNIVSNMPSNTVSVVACCGEGDAEFDAKQSYRTARIGAKPSGYTSERLRAVPSFVLGAVRELTRGRDTIIHAGQVFPPAGPAALILNKTIGLPYIVYLFAEELNQVLAARSSPAGAVKTAIYRSVLLNADGFVVVSDYTARLAERFGVEAKRMVKVIPAPAFRRAITPGAGARVRSKYGVPPDAALVLSVGRLIERKGFDTLLKAFPAVLKKVQGARLIISGRGPEESALKRLSSSLGLNGVVTFTGYVPEDLMTGLFEACDVFAMPHRELPNGDTEGCPTVFLEAAVFGKPSVGGNAGGVGDAIIDGETGLVVDGHDQEVVASAVARLLLDSGLAGRMGEAGLKRVRGMSPARNAQAVREFIAGIASEKGLA
jgi:phosphatidylinositol alpha-1,6-mannosyltransferase